MTDFAAFLRIRREEEHRWAPPEGWDVGPQSSFWSGWEGPPCRWIYHLLDPTLPTLPPLRHRGLPKEWWEHDGRGSKNHGPWWMATSALGWALAGDQEASLAAADGCGRLFALQREHGHMLSEAVGDYAGGFHAGAGAAALWAGHIILERWGRGELLQDARRWVWDHMLCLDALRMPDGQVALVGARCSADREPDSWHGIAAALAAQIMLPLPEYDSLHPILRTLVGRFGHPGLMHPDSPVRWDRPRQAHRWLLVRASEAGLVPRPASAEVALPPPVAVDVYKWRDGGAVHVAVGGEIDGYPPRRHHAVWAPGELVRAADPVTIPKAAVRVLSTERRRRLPPPPLAPNGGGEPGSDGKVWRPGSISAEELRLTPRATSVLVKAAHAAAAAGLVTDRLVQAVKEHRAAIEARRAGARSA